MTNYDQQNLNDSHESRSKKNNRRTLNLLTGLFVLSSSFFPTKALAYDQARSETVRSEVGTAKRSSFASTPENQCPTLLKEWIEDDFKDKKSWGFDYKSEAKTCQGQIQAYRDYASQKNRNLNFDGPESLGKYFSEKFSKEINPAYKRSLEKCNSLPHEQAVEVQTRFYSAGTKFEAANSAIVDEVVYIDSVLPDAKGSLAGFECPPIWPDIKKKCEIQKLSARDCSSPNEKQERFDDLVKRTQTLIPEIEALISAQQNCIASFSKGPGSRAGGQLSKSAKEKIAISCDPIGAAIEIKRNEIPWVRGEAFQKVAVKRPALPRSGVYNTEYDLSTENLSKAVAQQLTHNREALASSYKSNLEDFRCLTNGPTNGQACEFQKIRTHLEALPELRKTQFTGSRQDQEARTYFEAEKCLLERHEDRERTKKVVDSSMAGIALTAVTFGLGEAIAGIQVINAASKMALVKQGLIAVNTAVNIGIAGVALKGAYQACSKETETVIAVAKRSDLTKENVCSSSKSGISQAKDRENNCIVAALLSAPSVLPFAGAIPSLRNLTNKSVPAATSEETAVVAADNANRAANVVAKVEKPAAPAPPPAQAPPTVSSQAAAKETATGSAGAPKTATVPSKGKSGTPEYLVVGSKDAESAVKLGDTLRARSIDPKSTHIPEFAGKVDSHVDFARKSIQAQNTSDTPERLKLLNDFAAEAAARVRDGKVTYEWWHDYNYRLSILMTPAKDRTAVAGGYEDKFARALLDSGNWKTAEGFRETASKQEARFFSMYEPHDVAKAYPGQIVIPSVEGDLGIAALNATYGSNTSIIGMVGNKLRADGREMHPDHFFRHDHVHVGNDAFVNSRYEIPVEMRTQLRQNYMQYRDSVPNSEDRRNAFEFSYFIVTHELPGVDSITRERGNFTRLTEPDMVKMVRDPDWYAGAVPAWAKESDAGAKKFLEMSLKELKAFSEKYYKNGSR